MRAPTPRLATFGVSTFAAFALLGGCGDDSAGTGGGGVGGDGTTASATTGSTTSGGTTSGTTTGSSTTTAATTSGTGGEGGQGSGTGGSGGATGTGGAGGAGQPAECTEGNVADAFTFETQLVVDGTYDCVVDTVTEDGASHVTDFTCIQGDIAFIVTVTYTVEPALTLPFPLESGMGVTLDTYEEIDFPSGTSHVIRSANDGALLLAWVDNYDLDPPGAPADWSAPTTLTSVDGLCAPDVENDERRAIDIETSDAGPLRVFSEHVGVLSSAEGDFELRVSRSTYNPDILGGCNSCVSYALVAPAVAPQ